jgi:hypothetical protein
MPHHHPWSQAELELLRLRYPRQTAAEIAQALGRSMRSVYSQARELGLRKPLDVIAQMSRQRVNSPGHASQRTRFTPGNEPWNKGQPGSCGHHPNTRKTQWQPGCINHNTLPLGALRVNPDGLLERKIAETKGAPHLRWRPVHRIVWEQAHGPVPDGCVVVFRPGRKTAELDLITPDALELVTRAENMRRNCVHAKYPPELVRVSQLRGVLTRQINRKAKEQQP